jgi:prepilin-type N-terminal cleavage/methylation domain-containing protein
MKTHRLCPSAAQKSHHAFTLIELLVVMVIITILAGIAFPVITSVFRDADKMQAKKACTELRVAIDSFYYDTKRFPVGIEEQTGEDVLTRSSAAMIAHLTGENDIFNREKTPYFNGNQAKGGKGGLVRDGEGWKFVDPWAMLYYIELDTDRDGAVATPFESGLRSYSPAIVYSYGRDGRSDTLEDNVQSWK